MVGRRNHELRKGHRLDRHRLLKEPVEQLTPVPRRPAIKTVGNLPRRRHTTHWAWLTQVDTPHDQRQIFKKITLPRNLFPVHLSNRVNVKEWGD